MIAARKLRQRGFLGAEEQTVLFSTGSGLMHADLIDVAEGSIDPNATDLVGAITAALTSA